MSGSFNVYVQIEAGGKSWEFDHVVSTLPSHGTELLSVSQCISDLNTCV